tara:strand:- start:30 stop:152 length:123 start_codon:yes stop_codon:yes gene_type:complete
MKKAVLDISSAAFLFYVVVVIRLVLHRPQYLNLRQRNVAG